jgi:hypothetical protein
MAFFEQAEAPHLPQQAHATACSEAAPVFTFQRCTLKKGQVVQRSSLTSKTRTAWVPYPILPVASPCLGKAELHCHRL